MFLKVPIEYIFVCNISFQGPQILNPAPGRNDGINAYYNFLSSSLNFLGRKRRDERQFPGASVILRQLSQGVQRKRVGFVERGPGAPVRRGAVIYDGDGNEIGSVTSGCPSPSLSQNIGMGYVDSKFTKNGTEIQVGVRGQKIPMVVTKMPFVKPNYYSKPKQ